MSKIIQLTIYLTLCAFAVKAETAGVDMTLNLSPTLALSVKPKSSKHLKKLFQGSQYSWDSLDEGVPPLILESLPDDLNLSSSIDEKKKIFFLSLLPMILLTNEKIAIQRREIEDLISRYDTGDTLGPQHHQRITEIASEYGLKGNPLKDKKVRRKLLERVDIIPPSLALAQAANESAWGTSRFTRLGNNLYGEWTFTPGTGLIPLSRPQGATYEVRRFDNIYSSIMSYIKNLNTHSAYKELRRERYRLKSNGLPVRGIDLAKGLIRYSERREAYVREIQSVIRQNNLTRLSTVRLRSLPSDVASVTEEAATTSPNPYSRRSSRRVDP